MNTLRKIGLAAATAAALAAQEGCVTTGSVYMQYQNPRMIQMVPAPVMIQPYFNPQPFYYHPQPYFFYRPMPRCYPW